jgi:hypothetical protein
VLAGGIDSTCYEALRIDHAPGAMPGHHSASVAVTKLLQFVEDLDFMSHCAELLQKKIYFVP